MTCSECGESTAGQPIILVYAGMDDDGLAPTRFTGIVWHLECAPAERRHLEEECRAIQHATQPPA